MYNLFDFIGKDELFLELLDWPKTFAKVFGSWAGTFSFNHSHLIVTPPLDGVVPKTQAARLASRQWEAQYRHGDSSPAEGLAQGGVLSH